MEKAGREGGHEPFQVGCRPAASSRLLFSPPGVPMRLRKGKMECHHGGPVQQGCFLTEPPHRTSPRCFHPCQFSHPFAFSFSHHRRHSMSWGNLPTTSVAVFLLTLFSAGYQPAEAAGDEAAPRPAATGSTIAYELPRDGLVSLHVRDASARWCGSFCTPPRARRAGTRRPGMGSTTAARRCRRASTRGSCSKRRG